MFKAKAGDNFRPPSQEIRSLDSGRLLIRDEYYEYFSNNSLLTFEELFSHPGHAVAKCAITERNTVRLDLDSGSGSKQGFFVKRHLSDAHASVSEWRAMWRFLELGIPGPDPAAFGSNGRHSLVVSKGVQYDMKLSEWARVNLSSHMANTRQSKGLKSAIVGSIAEIVGRMHTAGMCHQDLYLCHFLMQKGEGRPHLTLIDLQRVNMFDDLPVRWRIKDLAQLYFSASDYITARDIDLFWRRYISISPVKFPRFLLWSMIFLKSWRIKRHTARHNL